MKRKRNAPSRPTPSSTEPTPELTQPDLPTAPPAPSPPPPRSSKSQPPPTGWTRLKDLLAVPVNGASLAVFRIAVGLIMALEARSITQPSASVSGSTALETYYSKPPIQFSFPYEGFEWLPLLPGPWILALVWALGIGGILITLGLL